MDNQEAKFLLRAYRPGGADANDPAFSGALDQARKDPEVGKWFEREQALDRAVAQKLRGVHPPAGLRETILAGGRISNVTTRWWKQPAWMSLAAAILIFAGAGVVWPKMQARAEINRLTAWAIDDTLHGQHGSHGSATARLSAFLSNPATHLAGATLPVTAGELSTTGCRTLKFAGREVVELCFVRSGTEYHFYVMTGPSRIPRSPHLTEEGGASAMAWSDPHYSYVLATTAAPSALKALL